MKEWKNLTGVKLLRIKGATLSGFSTRLSDVGNIFWCDTAFEISVADFMPT